MPKILSKIHCPHFSIIPLIFSAAIIVSAFINTAITTDDKAAINYGRVAKVTGIVAEDITYKKNDYRIILKTVFGEIYIMINRNPNTKRSDELTFEGVIKEGFGNYVASMYHPKLIAISHPESPDFALNIRDIFSDNVKNAINNSEQSGLALSYLTGQKNLLTEEQKQKLRIVGLSHIVVASGYHLGVIVGIAKKYLGKISRFATLSGALIIMICYICITGFSPSMVRAGLVVTLSLLTWYFGRKLHPARLVIYVAAISLLINQSYIANLAWQLSFTSYIGIIFLTPVLKSFFFNDKKVGFFAELIIASISAQLFCLPITIYNFGSISLLTFFANILITPTIPLVMLLTFITGITKIPVIAYLASMLLKLHLAIIDWLASFRWASYELEISAPQIAILYIGIISITLLLKTLTKHSYRPSYALEKSPDYGKIYSC